MTAGLDRPAVSAGVPVADGARVERQAHTRRLSRRQGDLLVPAELVPGLARVVVSRGPDVDLRDFGSPNFACVGDIESNGRRYRWPGHDQIAVAEGRVGQAVAKGEEGRDAPVVVPAIAHLEAFGVR